MYYRRIPNAVLVRNPELHYNYLNGDDKNTYSEYKNTAKQSSEPFDEAVDIPMPNKEQKSIEIEEASDNTYRKNIDSSKQRSNSGFRSFEFIIVLIIAVFIIAYNG